jgi:hypothetical protein
MPEVWLRTNRRALAVAMILVGLLLAVTLGAIPVALLSGGVPASSQAIFAGSMLIVSAVPALLLFQLIRAMRQPRLAYQDGELLVYLEPQTPTRVPIDIVECFFVGQGPSELPKLKGREPETQNVIVRLAEAATDWKHRDVRPAIGHWCEGYITLRGSWCEPITPALMRRLNHRLAEIHRQRKAARQEAAS